MRRITRWNSVHRSEKRPRECTLPINEKGELVITDMEKAEVLSEFFASGFTVSQTSHVSQVPETQGGGWGIGDPPTTSKEKVQNHLMNLNRHKSMGSDDMHPRLLRELVGTAKSLSIITDGAPLL
ncbi:rna-directed dna polymerase from mobile element jockey-like [Pitangus sulphuratus]|nr:rna-directed dna polymerase from mobile element jockey-like [Pitangus sulphuratus]